MNQFVASIHWVNVHHDYQKLSPQDEIMQNKAEPDAEPNPEIASTYGVFQIIILYP